MTINLHSTFNKHTEMVPLLLIHQGNGMKLWINLSQDGQAEPACYLLRERSISIKMLVTIP